MTRGTSIKYSGKTYMQAQAPFNAAFEYGAADAGWTGTVETGTPLTFAFRSTTAAVEVTVDGRTLGAGELSYYAVQQLVSFAVPAGTHAVVVSELPDYIERLHAAGALISPLYNQLKNNLAQALHQWDKGDGRKAAKHLENFLKHLYKSPMPSYATETARDQLDSMARTLIAR